MATPSVPCTALSMRGFLKLKRSFLVIIQEKNRITIFYERTSNNRVSGPPLCRFGSVHRTKEERSISEISFFIYVPKEKKKD